MKRLGIHMGPTLATAAFVFFAGGLVACSSEQPKPQNQATQSAQNKPNAGTQNQQQAQAGEPAAVPGAVNEQGGQQAGIVGMSGMSSADKLGIVSESPTTSRIATEKTVIQGQQIPTITVTRVGADINRMNVSDFKALGLTGDLSQGIVQYRNAHGPFKSVKDLGRVPNMDQGWLADNSERLAVAPSTATG